LVEVIMEHDDVITRDPEILGGTPVFPGTRVPLETLIDYLKAGDSLERFLRGFPTVSRDQALAFLQLAFDAALTADAHAIRSLRPGEIVYIEELAKS
jgi:uncharacterized protein (DUF433 family)